MTVFINVFDKVKYSNIISYLLYMLNLLNNDNLINYRQMNYTYGV